MPDPAPSPDPAPPTPTPEPDPPAPIDPPPPEEAPPAPQMVGQGSGEPTAPPRDTPDQGDFAEQEKQKVSDQQGEVEQGASDRPDE